MGHILIIATAGRYVVFK